MNVLIACEESGTVRDAFIAKGHNAWSCDLLPSRSPGPHYEGDVFDMIYGRAGAIYCHNKFDLMVAHPPCTYLANSGVCHLYNKDGSRNETRWKLMEEGALFFKRLLDAPIPRICVENPIPHKYALEIIGVKYTQIIQPWMFGHTEQKATCLWLKGLPKLYPTATNIECENNRTYAKMLKLPDNQRQRLHYMPPGPNRQRDRSVTFAGIADAMASQWG